MGQVPSFAAVDHQDSSVPSSTIQCSAPSDWVDLKDEAETLLENNNGGMRTNGNNEEKQKYDELKSLMANMQIRAKRGQICMAIEDCGKQRSKERGTKGPTTGKMSYTQADLDAAILAIRSGELGTRKASVHYGIPRSMLRNKIYKLEAAEEKNVRDGACKRRRMTALAMHKRRYDKDALNNAVAAVRNGRMSVHRAGSHFGVPHYMLEYTVKFGKCLPTPAETI